MSRFAVHSNLTIHHCHQLLGDRKSQPGAAVFARRGTIGLTKGLKEARLCLWRNAYASVLNIKAHYRVRFCFAFFKNLNNDLPSVSEFDGVADEICEDLAQSSNVTAQSCGYVRRYGTG